MLNYHKITSQQVKTAHDRFLQNEPRDLFYRTAKYLVDQAWNKSVEFSLAEAVSVLLQTWNRSYYQYHKFSNEHFAEIEKLIDETEKIIFQFRHRNINSLNETDKNVIVPLFQSFEQVIGPVGAAKTLHLLAPSFFPNALVFEALGELDCGALVCANAFATAFLGGAGGGAFLGCN